MIMVPGVDSEELKQYLSKYEGNLLQSVIPFWESHGIDAEFGGYFTSLDEDGSVFDTDKWMWMQWRIVYQYASLYQTNYQKDKWLSIAQQGYEFLTKHGKDPETGYYYFGLNRQGDPIVAPYNIFSEAFVVMGSAALFKATGEQRYKDEAISAMDHYLARIARPKGKWNKILPAATEREAFGPYMILANLGTVMKDCLGIDSYGENIAVAVDKVLNHFWNPDHGVIFENISPDGTPDLESSSGRHLIPGHGLEACWFILQYAEKSDHPELIEKTIQIIKAQLKFGWDTEFGGLYYFMDVLHKPHVELSWDMKLWWVHNEALIATLYGYRLSGDPEMWEWFKKIDKWTWEHFPENTHGEWFGYLNRRGEPTHRLKGGKWKTFFHLPRCLLTCIDQFHHLLQK